MLKPLIKKKAVPKKSKTKVKIKAKGTVCGACHYIRKDTDTNPAWQCPCCESAYSKVNVPEETHANNKSDGIKTSREKAQKIKEKINRIEKLNKQKRKLENTLSGIEFGIMAVASSVGSSCSRNPAMAAMGALIVIGSILYGISK